MSAPVTALLALGLCACTPGRPAYEFPSPDGAYLVRAEVRPWPPLARRVDLTLRHVEGEPVRVARFDGLERLELAWLGVGRLKVCAEGRVQESRERVEVASPRGRRTFEVSYGCPALGAAAAAQAARPRPEPPPREGERRLAARPEQAP